MLTLLLLVNILWAKGVNGKVISPPHYLRISTQEVNYHSNDTIHDIMISPHDPNQTLLITQSRDGGRQLISINNNITDETTTYTNRFIPFNSVTNPVPVSTSSVLRVVVQVQVLGEPKSLNSENVAFSTNMSGSDSVNILVTGLAGDKHYRFVRIVLRSIYNITGVELYGRNSSSPSHYGRSETYRVTTSSNSGLYTRRNLGVTLWSFRGFTKRSKNVSKFNTSFINLPVKARHLRFESNESFSTFIWSVDIQAFRDNRGLLQEMTHCGPSHNFYYFTGSTCIAKRTLQDLPTVDSKVFIGELLDTMESVKSSVHVSGVTCDSQSKTLYATFPTGTYNRIFKITLDNKKQPQIVDGAHQLTGSFSLGDGALYFFSSTNSSTFYKYYLNDDTKASYRESATSLSVAYADGFFHNESKFGIASSIQYIAGEFLILADKENNVLRVIDSSNGDYVLVYSVCTSSETRTDFPSGTSISEHRSVTNISQGSCMFYKPYLTTVYGNRMSVVDSHGFRITSYYIYKCSQETPPPAQPWINHADTTIRWTPVDECHSYNLISCEESTCFTNYCPLTREPADFQKQLTLLAQAPDTIISLRVDHIEPHSMVKSQTLFWPTPATFSFVDITGSIQYADTPTDSESYNVACTAVTPFPVKNLNITFSVNCEDPVSATVYTRQEVTDNSSRRLVRHTATLMIYNLSISSNIAQVPVYCQAVWKPVNSFPNLSYYKGSQIMLLKPQGSACRQQEHNLIEYDFNSTTNFSSFSSYMETCPDTLITCPPSGTTCNVTDSTVTREGSTGSEVTESYLTDGELALKNNQSTSTTYVSLVTNGEGVTTTTANDRTVTYDVIYTSTTNKKTNVTPNTSSTLAVVTAIPTTRQRDREEVKSICDTEPSPCLYGGRCIEEDNSFSCQCRPQYSGVTCSLFDACLSRPCKYSWLTCEKDLNSSQGFKCVENTFIGDQVKTDITCVYGDNASCNALVPHSVCHTLNFCYCPDTKVKVEHPTTNQNVSFIQCQPGKVKCRDQLDCQGVINVEGETVCLSEESLHALIHIHSDNESTCQCYHADRVNNVTGRCDPVIDGPLASVANLFEVVPWIVYVIGAVLILFTALLILGVTLSYRQQVQEKTQLAVQKQESASLASGYCSIHTLKPAKTKPFRQRNLSRKESSVSRLKLSKAESVTSQVEVEGQDGKKEIFVRMDSLVKASAHPSKITLSNQPDISTKRKTKISKSGKLKKRTNNTLQTPRSGRRR